IRDLHVTGVQTCALPIWAPVITRHLARAQESAAWDLIRDHVAKGRQAFVVCPLVEDSEKVEAASATAEHARLSAILSDLRVGLIHGQMRPADKEGGMSAFRAGEIDVLRSEERRVGNERVKESAW